jgi:ferric-dicitrate binding protein FerR (iron transport regulator)
MTNEAQPADSEDVIAAEAVDWLNQLHALGPAKRQEFVDWVCRSPRHYLAFWYLQNLTGQTGQSSPLTPEAFRQWMVKFVNDAVGEHRLPACEPTQLETNRYTGMSDFLASLADPPAHCDLEAGQELRSDAVRSGEIPIPTKPRAGKLLLLAAVCVLAVLGGLSLVVPNLMREEITAVYSTIPPGDSVEARNIRLADGSQINLDLASKVEVNFSKSRRELRLIRGNAHFTVKHDPKRPFVVIAGELITRDLGTKFFIRLMGDQDIEVNVQEGRVALDCTRTRHKSRSVGPSDCKSELEAGDRAEYHSGHLEVIKVEAGSSLPHAEEMPGRPGGSAWLSFNGLTLDEVVAQVNQLSDRHLRIIDPTIAQFRLGGSLRSRNAAIDDLLATLRHFGIRAELSDGNPREINLRRAL